MSEIKEKIKTERQKTALLLSSIPTTVVTLFVVSVVCMNLLANKTLLQLEYIALDGGILISWLSFMCMDVITKHFGPGASNRISILAAGITWFILLASTVAFLLSAVINNMLNFTIGKAFRKNPDGKAAFYTRAYLSTVVGQFLDNLIFSVIVFVWFAPIFWDGFSWTLVQCVSCALVGAFAELIMEIVFSPIGYRISERWKSRGVGKEYLEFKKG